MMIGFILGVATILIVQAIGWYVYTKRKTKRMIGVGYWVIVNAPTFDKSKQYRVVEATATHLFVSSDGLGLSARWIPRRCAKPSTKHDPYKGIT
jgi:hypothetical protein